MGASPWIAIGRPCTNHTGLVDGSVEVDENGASPCLFDHYRAISTPT